MNENKSINRTRRGLMALATTGTSGIVASQAIPSNWTKPVINGVFLPAHAKTSATVITSTPSSLTVTGESETGSDDISIVFDGEQLALVNGDGQDNFILVIDADDCGVDPNNPDADAGKFEIDALGSDTWEVIALASNIDAGSYKDPGTYSVTVINADLGTFVLTFTVSVSAVCGTYEGVENTQQVTVSNASIVAAA